jgi:hypothetical protein
MVHDEIKASAHMPFTQVADKIKSLPEGDRVDFFGGEPTLYPHFHEALELAAGRGLRISVASNCRAMASSKICEKIGAIPGLSVRTSLYGPTAEVHDYYTQKKGSFEQTLSGIRNLLSYGVPLQVNMAILPRNFSLLAEMIDLLISCEVRRVKFATIYGDESISEHLVDIALVRPQLTWAIFNMFDHGMDSQVEKSPLCLSPPFVNLFMAESDPGMAMNISTLYKYSPRCGACKLRLACTGVLQAYLKRYGDGGLQPFAAVPEYAIRQVSSYDTNGLSLVYPTEFVRIGAPGGGSALPEGFSAKRFVATLEEPGKHAFIVNGEDLLSASL